MQSRFTALSTAPSVEDLDIYNGVFLSALDLPPQSIRRDVLEKTKERKDLVEFFYPPLRLRKANYALVIGGESGSGKTHLAIYAAKIGLRKPMDERKTLIFFMKLTSETDSLKLLEKSIRDHLSDLEGNKELTNDERTAQRKVVRNKAVAKYLCKLMCERCGLSTESKGVLIDNFFEDKPFEHFHRTVLIVDEVITSKCIIEAVTTSLEGGFIKVMNETNIRKFFGDLYIVCCSTGSKDSIARSGSCPDNYDSIQMTPSLTLLKDLLEDQGLYKQFCDNSFTDLSENRRCAVEAYETILELNLKDCFGTSKETEKVPCNILRRQPPEVISNSIAGYVAMRTAAKYAGLNGLNNLTNEKRMHLVARVIRTFLEMPSWRAAHLPFQDIEESNDPVGKGIVSVHEYVENNPDETQSEVIAYTFSHAQLVLACCFYGTIAIPMNSSDTFEALSATIFALYLSAFACKQDKAFTLKIFLTALDAEWKDEDADKLFDHICPLEEGAHLDKLLFLDSSHIGCRGACLPFTDNYEKSNELSKKLLEDLRNMKENNSITAAMSPRLSNYADSLVVCGSILYLIQSKKREIFGGSEKNVARRNSEDGSCSPRYDFGGIP
ncbi:hypothetical protein STCU_12279 [Strigomonas culicis]|uniref:Uncharacterized protein n=1 Tax=Strigomonas culicis TaxID=28005 RepID=S9UKK9_9TRYP|nr:hypothetical protein STCU_12279 [Strigomonas culicis]|eukprot:EPY15181.1 hypothetical protein STCU_12279 [Strigomonas culicis]